MRVSVPAPHLTITLPFRSLPGALKHFYCHDALTYGAALAFFFLLSLFPLLIFLASALAYIPVPNLFDRMVDLMSLVMPTGAVGRVKIVLADILRTNLGLLSFGILGSIWVASLGFDAIINVLNLVFEVSRRRPYWKRRLLAVGLTALTGVMVVLAMLMGVLGPFVSSLLPKVLGVDSLFVVLWPYFRWLSILCSLVLALQIVYFLAPAERHSFASQTPGALFAVAVWIGVSVLLDWYFVNFANFRQTYGVLGAVIALLTWFYATALALLLGAELNAELLRHQRAQTAPLLESL
jgi:membrane protein